MSKAVHFTRREIEVLDMYRQALRDMGKILMISVINVPNGSYRACAFNSLARRGLFKEESDKFKGRRAYRLTDEFYSLMGAVA